MSYSSNNSSRKSQNRQPVGGNNPQACRKPNKALVFALSGLIMLAMISFIIVVAQGQFGNGKDKKDTSENRAPSVSQGQHDSPLGSPPVMMDQSMEANAARSGTAEFFPGARTVRFDKDGNPIEQ